MVEFLKRILAGKTSQATQSYGERFAESAELLRDLYEKIEDASIGYEPPGQANVSADGEIFYREERSEEARIKREHIKHISRTQRIYAGVTCVVAMAHCLNVDDSALLAALTERIDLRAPPETILENLGGVMAALVESRVRDEDRPRFILRYATTLAKDPDFHPELKRRQIADMANEIPPSSPERKELDRLARSLKPSFMRRLGRAGENER